MDLQHLRASDGTGEAVLAHIQTNRTPGSTVLDLDNVDNWNSKCVVVTGTPAANGFISPTGMKVMYGHLNAGDFIIDGYAPGYVDNGNTTSEIAIVKMTTSWADTLISLLGNALADTGFLKTTSLDHFFKPVELISDFVWSGGVVAQTAGLTGSFSDIVFYISGLRYSKTAVANKNYTASKDTYVDIDNTGTVYYTEVANGAASPALTVGRIRIAKVVTSGAAITSVTQSGSDSLGNTYKPNGPSSTTKLQNPVKFSVWRNAAQTATTGGFYPTYDTIDFNHGNCYNPANGRFTAPVDGYYQFNFGTILATPAMGASFFGLDKNGAEWKRNQELPSIPAGNNTFSGNTYGYLKAGDYVTVLLSVATNSPMVVGNQAYNWFNGFLDSRD